MPIFALIGLINMYVRIHEYNPHDKNKLCWILKGQTAF